jgi:hypothetical protein
MENSATTSCPETVAWVSWPLRDEPPGKTLLLLALMGLTSALAGLMAISAAPLAAILLCVLLGPYFLPTRYALSPHGVATRFPLFSRNRPWEVYKRYAVLKGGVFLGTFPHPSRLDSFRGDFLRFNKETDTERLLALVRAHVPAP